MAVAPVHPKARFCPPQVLTSADVEAYIRAFDTPSASARWRVSKLLTDTR